MKSIHLAAIFFIIHTSSGMKVRERLSMYKSAEARCIVVFSNQQIYEQMRSETFESLKRSLAYAVRDLNCTLVDDKAKFHTKIPGPNETYDGFAGTIQRNEADLSLWLTRPDLLPGEPGRVTPPFLTADLVIISTLYTPEERRYDLTKFLDLSIFLYIAMAMVVFFLIPVMYAFGEESSIDGLDPRNTASLLKRYMICCERIINLLLDQEQFSATTLTGHILALGASIITLLIVHGLILNQIGADLVTMRAKPPIDSLEDLLASNSTSMVVDQLYAYNAFKNAPIGSKEHEVWRRIQEKIPDSIVVADFNSFSLEFLFKLLRKLWAHETVYVEVEGIGSRFPYFTCASTLLPNLGNSSSGFHISKEHFASGVMTGLFSHQIHPYTEKVLVTLIRAVFETGLIDGIDMLSKFTFPRMRPELGLRIDSKALQCLEGARTEEEATDPLDLATMKHFLHSWAIIWCAAFITLALELLFRPTTQNHRVQKNPRHHLPMIVYIPPNRSWRIRSVRRRT